MAMWSGCDLDNDDLLSWRSFDTTLDTDGPPTGVDGTENVLSETASDVSDGDELAELIDRSRTDALRLSRCTLPTTTTSNNWSFASAMNLRDSSDNNNTKRQLRSHDAHDAQQYDCASEPLTLAALTTHTKQTTDPPPSPPPPLLPPNESHRVAPTITLRIERASARISSPQHQQSSPSPSPPPLQQRSLSLTPLHELPSTSEMVRINDDVNNEHESPPLMALNHNDQRSDTHSLRDWPALLDTEHSFMQQDAHALGDLRLRRASPLIEPTRRNLQSLFPAPLAQPADDDNDSDATQALQLRVHRSPADVTSQQQQQQQQQTLSQLFHSDSQPATPRHAAEAPHDRRAPMTLSQLLALPPITDAPSSPLLPPVPSAHATSSLLSNSDAALAEQRVQAQLIEQLEAELTDQAAQTRRAVTESHTWRERCTALESQLAQLQQALADREQHDDAMRQQLTRCTADVAQLQTRCLALQDANENLQAQTKRAVDESERVQRDYTQVVFELGKAQKQLNATAHDAAASNAREHLVRHVEQLQQANDALQQQLQALDRRAHCGSGSSIVQPPPPAAAVAPARVSPFAPSPSNPLVHNSSSSSNGFGQNAVALARDRRSLLPPPPPPAPSTLLSFASSMGLAPSRYDEQQQQQSRPAHSREMYDNRAGLQLDKHLSLRDMVGEQRPSSHVDGQHHYQQQQRNAMQPLTLASMGFAPTRPSPPVIAPSYNRNDDPNGMSSQATAFDRGGNASRFASFPPAAVTAPFAADHRQAFQLDASQRRHLEQRLMSLQLEKDQMESKALKLEQAGLRSMSARSEKHQLDARIHALAQDVTKLKLTLR